MMSRLRHLLCAFVLCAAGFPAHASIYSSWDSVGITPEVLEKSPLIVLGFLDPVELARGAGAVRADGVTIFGPESKFRSVTRLEENGSWEYFGTASTHRLDAQKVFRGSAAAAREVLVFEASPDYFSMWHVPVNAPLLMFLKPNAKEGVYEFPYQPTSYLPVYEGVLTAVPAPQNVHEVLELELRMSVDPAAMAAEVDLLAARTHLPHSPAALLPALELNSVEGVAATRRYQVLNAALQTIERLGYKSPEILRSLEAMSANPTPGMAYQAFKTGLELGDDKLFDAALRQVVDPATPPRNKRSLIGVLTGKSRDWAKAGDLAKLRRCLETGIPELREGIHRVALDAFPASRAGELLFDADPVLQFAGLRSLWGQHKMTSGELHLPAPNYTVFATDPDALLKPWRAWWTATQAKSSVPTESLRQTY